MFRLPKQSVLLLIAVVGVASLMISCAGGTSQITRATAHCSTLSGLAQSSSNALVPVASSVYLGTSEAGLPTGTNGSRDLYALRASDGKLLWRFQSNADTSSLMASGRAVYLAMYSQSKLPGSMWALRSNDGAILWRFQTGDAIGASFSEIRNGMMYINSTSGGDQNVSALRTSDGALLWHYKIPHDQAPLFLTGSVTD